MILSILLCFTIFKSYIYTYVLILSIIKLIWLEHLVIESEPNNFGLPS